MLLRNSDFVGPGCGLGCGMLDGPQVMRASCVRMGVPRAQDRYEITEGVTLAQDAMGDHKGSGKKKHPEK